jgi:hypothetical protein
VSAPALSARRLRQLDAIGVIPYRLRSRDRANAREAAAATTNGAMPAAAATVRVAVICEQSAGATAQTIAAALGLAEAALHWHVPADGRLPELDQNAAAFLVLGAHLARVLGAELPTAAQQAATIVVTAAPQEWRGNALAKRLLWQALRPLRRHLREQTWSRS